MNYILKYSLLAILILYSSLLWADARKDGADLYVRLTGSFPTEQELNYIEALIVANKAFEAGNWITENNHLFYSVTVKGLVTPWTNRENNNLAPLNDMSALMIGLVRDNIPFNQLFYTKSYYYVDGVQVRNYTNINSTDAQPLVSILNKPNLNVYGQYRCPMMDYNLGTRSFIFRGLGLMFNSKNTIKHFGWTHPTESGRQCEVRSLVVPPISNTKERLNLLSSFVPDNDHIIVKSPYSDSNYMIIPKQVPYSNEHFEAVEKYNVSLKDPQVFIKSSQLDSLNYSSTAGIAGIFSTSTFGNSFLTAGTNRAAMALVMDNFFCKSLDTIRDNTISDEFVRGDITRIPSSSPTFFKENCLGCHAGLDALSNAFSYHDSIGGRTVYTPGVVVNKINKTQNNSDSSIANYVYNDSWRNFWKTGLNSGFQWGALTSGNGIVSLGRMLSETQQFSRCMAKRVIEKTCPDSLGKISTADQNELFSSLGSQFTSDSFNMRKLLILGALKCSKL